MNLYSSLYNEFDPFKTFYPDFNRIILTKKDSPLTAPGLLILWGGSDIHPSLYGRDNIASHVGREPSARDEAEVYHISAAIEAGIPIIGICRGAQLACAAAKGILIQHVDNHCETHFVTTSDGRKLVTSSLHHQMMYPWKIEHELLAWASPSRITELYGLSDEEMKSLPRLPSGELIEPEIVYFPTIKCLAIQGHPEYMEPDHAFNLYVKELIDGYLLTK